MVLLLAAKLTQFPAALAAGEGGACSFDWCRSNTVHDLFSTGQVPDKHIIAIENRDELSDYEGFWNVD